MNWWNFAEYLDLISEGFEEAEVTHSLLLNFTIWEKFFEENKVNVLKFGSILAYECLIDESWLSDIIIMHPFNCRIDVDCNKTIVIFKLNLVMVKLKDTVEDVGRQLPRLLFQVLIESESNHRFYTVQVFMYLHHVHVEVRVV